MESGSEDINPSVENSRRPSSDEITPPGSPHQRVKLSVTPGGYRFEGNGIVKTYASADSRYLDARFEKTVAKDLGVEVKDVALAIIAGGGLPPHLADEWAFSASDFSKTETARETIRS